MRDDTAIIEELRSMLGSGTGRQLYAVVGSYLALDRFAACLREAPDIDGRRFPEAISVNRELLAAFPDDEFRKMAEEEAVFPTATRQKVKAAFETFVRSRLRGESGQGLLTLRDFELLFAYNLELAPLRPYATDLNRVLLLLPGRVVGDRVDLFSDAGDGACRLPSTLIAQNHLWELSE